MRFRSLSVLGMLAVLGALLLAVSASGAPGDTGTRTYIVQMLKDPVAAYDGGVAGIPATRPAPGARLDADSAAARRYVEHLEADHAKALAQVGGAPKTYDYSIAFNGFAAELTEAQASKLEKVEGVLAVTEDVKWQPDTSTTPSFLGLDKPGGLWQRSGGVGLAGEDVIIGIIDTGIWPEHPSFSDRAATRSGLPGRLVYGPPPAHWSGICQTGEEWDPSDCNNKLIGARFYNHGFGDGAGVAEKDFLSPRDWNGHGSHTTSTAGGNHGVTATGDAALLGKISGMAPRARVAAYKVCWEADEGGGCFSSDSVAAIDQAVDDGVDVLNFSISGSRTNFLDPVEVAFLFAANAGVFVAASAGNSGPGASTVAHPGPWLTTVAASTHDRGGLGSVTLGNGTTYAGASLAANSVSGAFVDSENAGKAGANATEVRLCVPGTLDPAKVGGKIVQCDRGVIARIDKSFAVKEAGGIGMVMTNTSPIGVNADLHYVPTVHLESNHHDAIEAYAATPGATATIAKGQITMVPAPFMAGFSSRGPLLAGDGDVLKPDVSAPGVDVLAAVAPPGNRGRLFDLFSGTSMSSPHVAGIAALHKRINPSWSPMAIKSALMTTGYDVPGANQFAFGAGHVDTLASADPGLVYDSGFFEWLTFLQGTGCNCLPPSFPKIDPSNLNQASIAIGQLAGRQTVTRRVTNVFASAETYTPTFSIAGIDAVASPASFTVNPGQTVAFNVTFTRTTAPLNQYALGWMRLVGSLGHSVRSPIAIKPVPLSAPAEVKGTGTSGSKQFEITFGFDGPWSAAVRGLVPADKRPGTVSDDPTNNFDTSNPDGNQGIVVHDFVVPGNTTYARFSLFDTHTDGNDDLDLFIYRVQGATKTLVGLSAGGTAEEEVNLVDPAAGVYKAYVHGWQTDGPDANYTLFGFLVGNTSAGNATLTPSSGTAVTGASQTITLAWSGLTAGTKYLGRIAYSGSTGMPLTTVRIDTDVS